MKLTCIIVDDESLARNGLEKYVKKIDFLELKGVCKNAMQVNTILNEHKIDLLFMDIEMPMISGIDFLKSLSIAPRVIFTTAYSEYAIDSFEFDVVDYLIKPISFERFLQASNKAFRQISKEGNTDHLPEKAKDKVKEEEFIFVKTDKQLVKVKLDEILYIESMQNYIRIITTKETHITLVPLKKILEILPTSDFIQVHKSFVIAKSKVEAISGNQIIIGKNKIHVTRSFKEAVIKSLTSDRILKK